MLGSSFNNVRPFAEDLARAGISLQAAPNSLLAELISLSSPVDRDQDLSGETQGTAVAGQSPEEVMNNTSFQIDFHSAGEYGQLWGASFDSAAMELAERITKHIDYIRNKVVPRVLEFADDSSKYLEELGGNNAAAELEINRGEVHDLVSDQAFLMILEQWKFRDIVEPDDYSMYLEFKNIPEDFLSVATLSNSRLDKLVAEWSGQQTIPYLQSAWHSFFAASSLDSSFKGPYLSRDDLKSANLFIRLNAALAYFLIAQYYNNNLPDVQTSIPTEGVKRKLFQHVQYAGSVLSDTLHRLTGQEKSDMLVTHVDAYHKRITVNAAVYDRWIQAGGNAEIILGILVGEKQYFSVPEITAHAKELEQAWANYTNIYMQTIEIKKAVTLRTFYLTLLARYLTPEYQDQDEQDYVLTSPHHDETVLRAAENWLHGLRKNDLCDTQKVAKYLVANLKYGFTAGYKFICDMDDIGAHSDGAIPEEAALVATANYFVDYLHGQIASVRV